MDLLLLALLVALVVWSARRVRAWVSGSRAEASFLARPGASADNPLVLTSRSVLDDARGAVRCTCGGRVQGLGETSRLGLRVARGRCVECEEDVDLYFVLPHLLN